jgi:phosphohistidine swiveling domain-containing protein
VIPTHIFSDFISSRGIRPLLIAIEGALGSEPPKEILTAARQTIMTAPLPEELPERIQELFRQWASEFGGQIIVRSSATVEDNEHRSYAGIFESIPCGSSQELEDAVRRVWASAFSPRAFAYYGFASLKHVPAMAVILQPYVEADRSGIMFTSYLDQDHKHKVLVEHTAGSGEKLVKGQVNPDRFWIPQWPKDIDDLTEITGELSLKIAMELAHVAYRLEQELELPQDVEWCVRDEQLYILQTRPITIAGQAAPEASEGEVLLRGVGASPGWAGGAVHLVFNIEDADALQARQVLTTTMTNPDMVPSMQRSAAVVTDVGGMICHAAIVSRELGIPCVVGTKSATQVLKPGDQVTVDGSTGVVLRDLVELHEDAKHLHDLTWSDLWQDWQSMAPAEAIPLISVSRALFELPHHLERCVLDPFCDLIFDTRTEIVPLAFLEEEVQNQLLRSYVERVSEAVDRIGIREIFLDLHRLDPVTQSRLVDLFEQDPRIRPLKSEPVHDPWLIGKDPDGRQFALLEHFTPSAIKNPPYDSNLAVPLGLARLLHMDHIDLPEIPKQGPEGMFGMMPEVRMARVPSKELREPMHRLVPILSQAHGGNLPDSDQEFPWLNIRPEVIITPFLKAFVTPGVESIPLVLGFTDPPLHIQFIRCRFHFRQDTLFNFFPKLMEATWDEEFLSNMLRRCRDSYEKMESLSESLPTGEQALVSTNNPELCSLFVAWWNAFTEFFSLSFFIQAQGDDCVFPVLRTLTEGNTGFMESNHPDWRIPGLAELSAPVTPVLTTEYVQDLLGLKQTLSSIGLTDLKVAEQAIVSEDKRDLKVVFEQVRERWYWMRERDLYYDPYDTPAAILDKALSIRNTPPPDLDANHAQFELALALHFDLARVLGVSEKLVYAVKYARALAIDRENHHVVWLRASYRLRKLLQEWERQLGGLQHKDIFFLQPWEILETVTALPQPISEDLLARLRNRRTAYETEIQLKVSKESNRKPHPEEDYY